MPLDPLIANPPAMKLDDQTEVFGRALNNALAVDKIDTSRRTRERTAAVDLALKNATDKTGVTRRGDARYAMAQAGVGTEGIATDEGWGKVDHLNAQTEHQKTLATQARIAARGKLFENTMKELGSVTADPKLGPLQMLSVFENTYPDLVETMGEERAGAVLKQRVDTLKAAINNGTWKEHHRKELLGAAAASKRHFDEVNLGDKKAIVSFDEHGGGNGRTEFTGQVGIDPNAVMQERGRNVRQVKDLSAKVVRQDDQQGFQQAQQGRQFGNQAVNREDQQGFQQAQQGRQFGQQNTTQATTIAAQKEAALARAAEATAKAERAITAKRNEAQAVGASIIAREINERFPSFAPQGVMGKQGDEGWVKLNLMPTARGGPDKLEIEMFKKYLGTKGMAFVQGDLGQASWAVPATRLDAQTLRKQNEPPKPPKLVADENNNLVEAKVGVKVPGRAAAAAKRSPNYDKEARDMFKTLYKDSAFIGPQVEELNSIRTYLKKRWEYENAGGPPPGPVTFGPGVTQDVIRAYNALQQDRLRSSQIDKNNARTDLNALRDRK